MKPVFTIIATIFTIFISSVSYAQSVALTTEEKNIQTLSKQIEKVDALFAEWNKPDTPGLALAIVKDGKVIYSRGYGMANLEQDAPITPTTVFHVASVSKQFTAFAIQLLAQKGKLSLDDDVRKFLPELHDFGKTITIRHLLHHTSGLRDQWDLLALAGWRPDDAVIEKDILNLLWSQRELNFQPGQKMTYCNSGYTLLGVIVQRVSGRSLPEFTKERIFNPLGMYHTHFPDDYSNLVKGRASSYGLNADGKYQYYALSHSTVGATGLLTTVEDLALWDQNFYSGKVGGAAVLNQMLQVGSLNSGKKLDYASGLILGSYRGLDTVDHTGADAGFRSNLLRFPGQHFSVIALSNAAEFNPVQPLQKVADIFLEDVLSPQPEEPKQPPTAQKAEFKEIKLKASQLDAFVGDYALSPSFVISITREGNQLMAQATGQEKLPIFAAANRTFFLKAMDMQFTFDRPDKNGKVNGGILHQYGIDQLAKKITLPRLTPDEAKAREGKFYSDELQVLYTVTHDNGRLSVTHPRGKAHLMQITPTIFSGDAPIGKLQYTCFTANSCNSFTLSGDRIRNIKFNKVKVEAIASGEEMAATAAAADNAAPPFKSVPFYLRGNMNQWGLRDQMLPQGNNLFQVNIPLEKGDYEFKVGSDDFSEIDFGFVSGEESGNWVAARKMEMEGGNFSIAVPQSATYSFIVDATDPYIPKITVKTVPTK